MTSPHVDLQFGLRFDTFKPCEQMKRVVAVMESGKWMTLSEIARETLARFSKYDSEAGISARIRQFKFMGMEYEKRVREGYEKLYEYRRVM